MKYIYVANWKMNLSFDESINFCNNYGNALQQLSNSAAKIIICPSFVALAPMATLLKNSTISLGAQNCSEHESGSYTGEVSALSIAQTGATHCIVGHSEQRIYHNESTEKIINKIKLLYQQNITPIICIGETKKDFLSNQTFATLTKQLEPILTIFKQKSIMIAYEPVWSIGTDIIPTPEQLIKVFTWLQLQIQGYNAQLLYGGSVNQNNIVELKKISLINGFLIGGASTNFEKLKKIVE
jgi:triosephosphate isomerase